MDCQHACSIISFDGKGLPELASFLDQLKQDVSYFLIDLRQIVRRPAFPMPPTLPK
jgi:hypothetical protein